MCDPAGSEPISPDEILYRRIPESEEWYNPDSGVTEIQTFRPTKADDTGLSLSRAKYRTPEQVGAEGRAGKLYWVAALVASDVTAAGVEVVPRPTAENPGHSEAPSLNYQNRKSNESVIATKRLRDSIIEVTGPFAGSRAPPETPPDPAKRE
jgi:hypothetical protein